MRKIYVNLVVITICGLFSIKASAQTKLSDWHFDAGVNIANPIRTLGLFSSFGIGVDGAATTMIVDNVNVGARVNYSYFFGKTSLIGENNGGVSVFNVLADGSYNLPYNTFVGVDLGVGFSVYNGYTDTEFARIFNVGYKWEQSKEHTFIFTLYFDQTTSQKCLGLRGALRF